MVSIRVSDRFIIRVAEKQDFVSAIAEIEQYEVITQIRVTENYRIIVSEFLKLVPAETPSSTFVSPLSPLLRVFEENIK